jgi:serine protease AprX
LDQTQRIDRAGSRVRSILVVLLALLLVIGATPAQSAAAADNELQNKIDPALLARVRSDLNGSYAVVVRGSTDANATGQNGQSGDHGSSERARSAVRGAGATVGTALSIVGATSAVAAGREIITLARNGHIAKIVSDSVFSVAAWDGTEAAERVTSSSTLATNAPRAWSKFGLSGQGVGVAVLDSGVAAHPDLGNRVVASVDFVEPTGIVSTLPLGDAGGHGTHVAGIIAGDGSASNGTITGIAPLASIVSVRVIDALGTTTLSRVLTGMQWIIGNRSTYNIRIVNISFGAPAQSGYRSDLLAAASENMNFAGLLVVAAAGNAGSGPGTIITPAIDPYVLAVGAIDDRGSNSFSDYSVTPWSSRGPTPFDGLAKPDLVAPGRQVVSLRVPGSTLDLRSPDNRVVAGKDSVARYFTLSGTSMAAPMVAGTAALLIERYPAISTAQLRQQLKVSARPLSGYTALDQGSGLVDAFAAASRVPTAVPSIQMPVSDAFAQQAKPYLTGQPFAWINPGFNGGVDSKGRPWADVTWDNIMWDGITWQNLDWEAFTWQGITWQGITWTGITWQGITWQGVTWQGITWTGITWLSAPLSGSSNWEQVK